MPRPSPRTLGVTTDDEGETVYFTKFGTQQLKFIDPAKPALGVKQVNVGQTFKMLPRNVARGENFKKPRFDCTMLPWGSKFQNDLGNV